MTQYDKSAMVSADQALPGNAQPMQIAAAHYVLGSAMRPPFPEESAWALFGMGCFWGAERRFWQQPGIITTAVGYAGGFTENPGYEQVCTGGTGHTEVVLVVWNTQQTSFKHMLKVFWEAHDPTQGMRQGNDLGTQYRSAIYCSTQEQLAQAKQSTADIQAQLQAQNYGAITTEIASAPTLFYAEDYHQQYLAKNPGGYCGLRGTGISCAI